MMKYACLSGRKSVGRGTQALIRGLCTAVNAEVKKTVQQPGKSWVLYQRLWELGSKKGLVEQTIDEYIREGRVASREDLRSCIMKLRKYRKYHQSLEILEWMDRRNMSLTISEHAKRLDLLCKTKGIAAAEDYFTALPPPAKNRLTYGSLLNCYCVEKMKDKALDLFEKMQEMNTALSTLAFNNIMALYMRLGQPEKVPPLVQEMKRRNIQLCTFTYNILMRSYSSLDDIEGVERVFEEGGQQCVWSTYSNLAAAYVRAGLHEKAELALKKLEQVMGPRNHEAFHCMISTYASTSNLDEVHRVWKSLKSSLFPVTNLCYRTMLEALSRLNDIDGLKKCFMEWESACVNYDIRLANVAIGAYLKHDMVNEAESVLHHAIERSSGPFFIALEMLMMFCLKKHEIKLALRCMEALASGLNGSQWRPKTDSISTFLSYFKQEKDVDSAEQFCKYLKKANCLDQCIQVIA